MSSNTFISDFKLRAIIIFCGCGCDCGNGGGSGGCNCCNCCCCCTLTCKSVGLRGISGFGCVAGAWAAVSSGDFGRTRGGGFSSSSRLNGKGLLFFLAVKGAFMKGFWLDEVLAELDGVRNLLFLPLLITCMISLLALVSSSMSSSSWIVVLLMLAFTRDG